MGTSRTDTDSAPDTEAAPAGTLQVGLAVVAFRGTDREAAGRIVDDFGEFTPVATEYHGERIAEPARRWAVLTDSGELLFADSADLVPAAAAE